MPEVGAWSEEKYRIVRYYDEIFSTGMKKLWPRRVYVDLFSGAGYAKIEGSRRIVKSSALLALNVPNPFTKYVFCDIDQQCLNALRARVEREHPEADVEYVHGGCNEKADEIARHVLGASGPQDTLTFCFVDPFNVRFSFSTIATLAARCGRIDFLVLLALWMDVRRNESLYTSPSNRTIDELLGDVHWRERWETAKRKRMKFAPFVAEEFVTKMFTLEFLRAPKSQWKEFHTDQRQLPLYHLLFFSKHLRGYDFWVEAKKYGSTQIDLPLETI